MAMNIFTKWDRFVFKFSRIPISRNPVPNQYNVRKSVINYNNYYYYMSHYSTGPIIMANFPSRLISNICISITNRVIPQRSGLLPEVLFCWGSNPVSDVDWLFTPLESLRPPRWSASPFRSPLLPAGPPHIEDVPCTPPCSPPPPPGNSNSPHMCLYDDKRRRLAINLFCKIFNRFWWLNYTHSGNNVPCQKHYHVFFGIQKHSIEEILTRRSSAFSNCSSGERSVPLRLWTKLRALSSRPRSCVTLSSTPPSLSTLKE